MISNMQFVSTPTKTQTFAEDKENDVINSQNLTPTKQKQESWRKPLAPMSQNPRKPLEDLGYNTVNNEIRFQEIDFTSMVGEENQFVHSATPIPKQASFSRKIQPSSLTSARVMSSPDEDTSENVYDIPDSTSSSPSNDQEDTISPAHIDLSFRSPGKPANQHNNSGTPFKTKLQKKHFLPKPNSNTPAPKTSKPQSSLLFNQLLAKGGSPNNIEEDQEQKSTPSKKKNSWSALDKKEQTKKLQIELLNAYTECNEFRREYNKAKTMLFEESKYYQTKMKMLDSKLASKIIEMESLQKKFEQSQSEVTGWRDKYAEVYEKVKSKFVFFGKIQKENDRLRQFLQQPNGIEQKIPGHNFEENSAEKENTDPNDNKNNKKIEEYEKMIEELTQKNSLLATKLQNNEKQMKKKEEEIENSKIELEKKWESVVEAEKVKLSERIIEKDTEVQNMLKEVKKKFAFHHSQVVEKLKQEIETKNNEISKQQGVLEDKRKEFEEKIVELKTKFLALSEAGMENHLVKKFKQEKQDLAAQVDILKIKIEDYEHKAAGDQKKDDNLTNNLKGMVIKSETEMKILTKQLKLIMNVSKKNEKKLETNCPELIQILKQIESMKSELPQ